MQHLTWVLLGLGLLLGVLGTLGLRSRLRFSAGRSHRSSRTPLLLFIALLLVVSAGVTDDSVRSAVTSQLAGLDGVEALFQRLSLAASEEELPSRAEERLRVHFIDVGQGDAVLLEFPEQGAMLVDAGNNDDERRVVEYIRQQGIERLDYVVATHPHADHAGGLEAVLREVEIGTVALPRVAHTTKTWQDVLQAVRDEGLLAETCRAGLRWKASAEVTVQFVAPQSKEYEELNNYSAVLRVSYGDTSVLLTGDAERESETEQLAAGSTLSAVVLKVGHHGSATSTTPEYLEEVDPELAVISVGADNPYRHPHSETLELLAERDIGVLRTDEHGTIVLDLTGERVKIVQPKERK